MSGASVISKQRLREESRAYRLFNAWFPHSARRHLTVFRRTVEAMRNRPQSKEDLTVRISQSRESKEQLIAKQLILAAALGISLLLEASSARAQADTTIPRANITMMQSLGPSNTDLCFTGTSIVTLNGGCVVGTAKLDVNFCGRHRGETWLAMPFTPKQTLMRPCFRPVSECSTEPTSSC